MGDELRWAATELFLTTKQDSFLVALPDTGADVADVPTWNSVGTLGLISLMTHLRQLPNAAYAAVIFRPLVGLAQSLRDVADTTAYGIAMGRRADFVWGSNAVAANQGLVLMQAYRITRDTSFLRAAVANLDYLMGRNPTGYSFVTGVGTKTPMFPHHRPSGADTIVAPVPGLLVGGPNPSAPQQDRCSGYPSPLPALSFVDAQCSYASNEIAINWNAPIAYLSAAIDAEYRVRGTLGP